MENFDRENIDELLEIRQIRQYFPRLNFVAYGMYIMRNIILRMVGCKIILELQGVNIYKHVGN